MASARQAAVQEQFKNARVSWGKGLTRFCGYGLVISSMVKFIHPSKAVAYMASMGFEGGTFFVVAVLELISAILFLVPATRRVGLLLVSSYMGGAIAAHLAVHRFFTGGPFLVYMAKHPYVGAMVPGAVLVAGWAGTWLLEGAAPQPNQSVYEHREPSQHIRSHAAMGSAS